MSAQPTTQTHQPEIEAEAPVAHAEALAARPIVQAPEESAQAEPPVQTETAIDDKRDLVKPPEQQHQPAEVLPAPTTLPEPKPVQHVTPAVAPANDDVHVITPADMEAAEAALATAIGKHLAADEKLKPLAAGLFLRLSESIENGKGGVQLCLKGDNVQNNSTMLGNEVKKMLYEHPAFRPLLDKDSKPFVMKPTEADKADMVHVHIPNLTQGQYTQLIYTLGGKTEAPVVPNNEAAVQARKPSAESAAGMQVEAHNDNPVPTLAIPAQLEGQLAAAPQQAVGK